MKITSALGYSTQKKLSFKIDGAIKIFNNKQKLKQYMTTITEDSARNSAHRG
jgi:hypothetical protein